MTVKKKIANAIENNEDAKKTIAQANSDFQFSPRSRSYGKMRLDLDAIEDLKLISQTSLSVTDIKSKMAAWQTKYG